MQTLALEKKVSARLGSLLLGPPALEAPLAAAVTHALSCAIRDCPEAENFFLADLAVPVLEQGVAATHALLAARSTFLAYALLSSAHTSQTHFNALATSSLLAACVRNLAAPDPNLREFSARTLLLVLGGAGGTGGTAGALAEHRDAIGLALAARESAARESDSSLAAGEVELLAGLRALL